MRAVKFLQSIFSPLSVIIKGLESCKSLIIY